MDWVKASLKKVKSSLKKDNEKKTIQSIESIEKYIQGQQARLINVLEHKERATKSEEKSIWEKAEVTIGENIMALTQQKADLESALSNAQVEKVLKMTTKHLGKLIIDNEHMASIKEVRDLLEVETCEKEDIDIEEEYKNLVAEEDSRKLKVNKEKEKEKPSLVKGSSSRKILIA